jgi:hypothetical protein
MSGNTSFARCSIKPFVVLMVLLQAGQPGNNHTFTTLGD